MRGTLLECTAILYDALLVNTGDYASVKSHRTLQHRLKVSFANENKQKQTTEKFSDSQDGCIL